MSFSIKETHAFISLFHLPSQDPTTGIITTRVALDREQRAQYTVVVVAQDLGRPPQLASRLLVINITDADDNLPAFVKLPVSCFRCLGTGCQGGRCLISKSVCVNSLLCLCFQLVIIHMSVDG